MNGSMLLFPILIPAAMAICILLLPKTARWIKEICALIATALILALAIFLRDKTADFTALWGGFGMDFSLKLYPFSAFILLATAVFAFLICVYSTAFMKGKPSLRQFYAFMLLTLSFVNGAVLANNLIVMLFFWEGLLATLFAMIMTGGKQAFPAAVKAMLLNGSADLCLMLGVGITGAVAGTLQMDKINLPMNGGAVAGFVLMMIGAIAKAGSMPFHTWIPDAAEDTPLPFMAFLPAALEKLLGIYLLTRISLDLFQFTAGSTMSIIMMTIGVATILLAVMMALIQKDYKRLLAYHAVSQVGYMILGIGTALPAGIIGGLFHMINNAVYKSGLFLTGGAVEKQTGITDLSQLGGLGRKMPVTFGCFLVMAASIAGVPPFNGFFSKELIFDGALQSGWIFYSGAAIGAFFTAASFLKLGHAVFFGKQGSAVKDVREASVPMLVPMVVLASICVLFGIWNALPLKAFIQPILGSRAAGETFMGLQNGTIAGISMFVLLLSVINHIFGVKASGKALGAVDHIHYAPGLRQLYECAQKHYFDPYNISMSAINSLSKMLFKIDRGIDWFYDSFISRLVDIASFGVRKPHNGTHWMYVLWALGGTVVIGLLFLSVF